MDPMSSTVESECIIIFDDERITLTKTLLLNEPTNIFLTRFIEPADANGTKNTHEITIDADPLFFKLIQAHLRGYEIFPLADGVIPYLSEEATLKTFLRLAEKFSFQNLRDRIMVELDKFTKPVPKSTCLAIKHHHGPRSHILYSPTDSVTEQLVFNYLLATIGNPSSYLIQEEIFKSWKPVHGYQITYAWQTNTGTFLLQEEL